MKRTLYSLLLIFLLSCGKQPQNSSNVFVYMQDQTIKESLLLAVRDSSLLLKTYSASADGTFINESVKISDISFVYLAPEKEALYGSTGLVLGGIGGCAAGALYSEIAPYSDGYSILAYGLIGFLGGIIVGPITGCLVYKGNHTYYPYRSTEREFLRKQSVFPQGEPDELKKIK